MGDLSKNFSKIEFACKCGCGYGTRDGDVSPKLVSELQGIRDDLGLPMSILSGCRCQRHNKSVSGAKKSKHLLGIASDIQVSGMSPARVYKYLENKFKSKYGLGLYKTFVHFDVRPEKTRWKA